MLTNEQIEMRRTGLGASEIAAILGVDPFAGPLDIYLRKVEGFVPPVNSDMERGMFLEPGVADWYDHRNGTMSTPHGETLRHATRPLILATPDRTAGLSRDGDKVTWRLISIKCPRRAGDAWGGHGSQVVPERAVLQLQQEDAVLTSLGWSIHPVFHLAALVDGDLRIYEIERDVGLQESTMDFAEKWWAKHVAKKAPPPLDGSDAGHEWLRRRFPANVKPLKKADIGDELLLMALRDARSLVAKANARLAKDRQLVEEAIGDADGVEGAAGRVTWRANKRGVRVFLSSFADEE